MIENIISPKPLDNDVAVMKIVQLLGQLSHNDIKYIQQIVSNVIKMVDK
jgi:hypothetical protein